MRLLLVAVLFLVAACNRSKPAEESATPSVQQKRAVRAAEVPDLMKRHWAFLNRIRQGDAYNSVIHRTMLNDQNQLGVVLYSQVALETVPDLMRKVMTEMGQEFPNEDVTLAVYQIATPLKRIGTAQLDGKSEAATYTPM